MATPLALAGLLLLSATAWMPYVVVLLVAGTFAEAYAYPQLAFAGINPFLSELVLGLALAATSIVASKRRLTLKTGSSVVGASLAIFLAAALIGVGVGVSNGVKLFGALTQVREMAFVATFWLALVALRTPASRAKVFWEG